MRNTDDVVRIIILDGYRDHAGHLDSLSDIVRCVQKEEPEQIEFFRNYPTEFNDGRISALNPLDPIIGRAAVGGQRRHP